MIAVLPLSPDSLRDAAHELRSGRLVAFPTETVYGLGAKAMDPLALAKIFEAKRRPYFDPLILHIADHKDLEGLVAPGAAQSLLVRKLTESFWPGPLTLVLPKAPAVPDLATSGLPTVAVRMPAHPVARALIREAGFPLAAPSANPFGRLSPTTARHVQEHFTDGISIILDGGPCEVGLESTIISLAGNRPTMLRAGGLPLEEIESVIGPVEKAPAVATQPAAPGQLAGHYAPRTPLKILDKSNPGTVAGKRIGYLAFSKKPSQTYAMVELLSPTADLREAAASLFCCLHRLDRAGLDFIHAEPVEEKGLGVAIMDRLRKAATGSGEADHN